MKPNRRTFLTAAGAAAAGGLVASRAAARQPEEDVSRLGRTRNTRFAVNVEMWWTRLPFLMRQIALLQPRIILVVGRIAAQNLLRTDAPIGRLRGSLHHFGEAGIPLVVTYHPAYLLRSPAEKRKAWEDLKLARRVHAALPVRANAGA